MELVYLYAGHLGKCIDNTEINFSKNFEITYNKEQRNLKISKKNNPGRINIYGDNIRDINVLVGKNGIGKSTIMRLLGLPERDRNKYFSFINMWKPVGSRRKSLNTWFAVYHLYEDIFAIEGYWVHLLQHFLVDNPEVKPFYHIGFQYDFENSKVVRNMPLTEFTNEGVDDDSLFYVYFQNNTGVRWFNEYDPQFKFDELRSEFFTRLSCNAASYSSVIKYLIDSRHTTKFSAKMGTKPGTKVEIRLNHIADPYNEDRLREYNEDEGEERREAISHISKRIYGTEDTAVMSIYNSVYYMKEVELTNKQRYIISYLETIVDTYLYGFLLEGEYGISGYVTDTPYDAACGGKDTYISRKKYLLDVLEHAQAYEKPDRATVPYIIEGLEKIPDRYFTTPNTISGKVSKLKHGELDELMQALDVDSMNTPAISQKSVLRVVFSDMSAGEAHFIDVFASIHGALNARERLISEERKTGKQTCILLLDEPDMSFHPEWSRTFINNLADFLKKYKDINFQVIITTHSPLMLSDIRSDSIYCLGKDKKRKLKVTNPEYGLLSGINDILIDGFFTESVFGKFAEGYANKIVQELGILEDEIVNNRISQDGFSRKYSDLKNRINILGEGFIKERLIQRLIMVQNIFEMRNDYDQN